MELKFENCCSLTKETLLAMQRKSRNPIFLAAVIVLCVAYIVNGVRDVIAGYPEAMILPLVFSAALGLFAYFLPNILASVENRKNVRKYGREPKCITKFYDEKFVVENITAGSTVNVYYTRVVNFVQDERYIFIMLDNKSIAPLDKQDFITGTAEELMSFLETRDTKLRKRKESGLFGLKKKK